MTETLEANPGNIGGYRDVVDTAAAESSLLADGDDIDITWKTDEQVPGLPANVRNDREPLQGISVGKKEEHSAMARFVEADGPAEMLVKQGPLPAKRFALMSLLREVVQSSRGPLEYRPVAHGNTLRICATNEKTLEAFRLLAQGALGRSFTLSHE